MTQGAQQRDLPRGWAWATLGDICLPVAKVSPKENPAEPFTYLDIASIDNTMYRVVLPKFYLGRDAPSRARQKVRAGNTLFSTVRTYLKNVAMVPPEFDGQVASTGFCVLNPSNEIDPKFVFYHVVSDEFVSTLNPLQRGTSYPAVRDDDVLSQRLILAPLPEQCRIVAEIEKQFTRLDASVAALLRARANLKRYRASVLRAACSGELVATEAELARAEDREYEPASVLLERILAERRAHWEAQEKRRGKYKEPAAPDVSDLPTLPEGWAWATSSQVAMSMLGKMLDKKRTNGKQLPYLRNLNVRWDAFDLTDLATMPFVEEELDRYGLLPGDVLVAEGGEPGRAAVWRGDERPIKYQKALHRVRVSNGVLPKWLVFQLWASAQAGTLERYFTGSTIRHFTGQSFERFAVPLPPLAEQHRIVAEVERRLSVIQQAETAVEASLRRAERLRQSILKRAFCGELAPQDPDDEPASVLLERIRAQREAERAEATKKSWRAKAAR